MKTQSLQQIKKLMFQHKMNKKRNIKFYFPEKSIKVSELVLQ